MVEPIKYTVLRDGRWTLWVLAEEWHSELWLKVLQQIERQSKSKHPQTVRFAGGAAPDYYLKTYYPFSAAKALKDTFRYSTARRAQLISVEMAAAGFHAPFAIAAGEKRKRHLLQSAFLLTRAVPGMALIDFLRRAKSSPPGSAAAVKKHGAIASLGRELRRFHDLGFVHGDLVATNIFVCEADREPVKFYFMDNDRTRRVFRALPQSQWKRNLLQLNRMPLPGVWLHDRMRFLRAYLGDEFAKGGLALARWLEENTRRRRWECDGAIDQDFRRLMRWQEQPREASSGATDV